LGSSYGATKKKQRSSGVGKRYEATNVQPIRADSSDFALKNLVDSWVYSSALPAWLLFRIAYLEQEVTRLTNRVIELETVTDSTGKYPRK